MAAYGAQLEQGKIEGARRSSTSDSSSTTSRSRTRAPASPCRPSSGGKGDVLIAYENEAITRPAEGRGARLRDPRPDDPDREPDRGRRPSRTRPSRPRRSSTSCAPSRPRRCSARRATARSSPSSSTEFALPGAGDALHDRRRSAAGRRSWPSSSTVRTASWPRSSASSEPRSSERRGLCASPRRAPPVGARRQPRGRHLTAYLSLIVLIPLAALTWRSTQGGWSAFWEAITDPQAVASLKITLVALAGGRGHQRGRRDRDRLGARARLVPRQEPAQRRHRPPLRAADDRRRAHAARPVRAAQPARRQRRLHAGGGGAGAAVRDAAVRRAHGAAGAARARPGDGGGGGVARRRPLRDLPPHRPSEPPARRSCPASRSPSRARSASSARSC